MEYKIKVNLRVDDILFLVLVYIGLGIVFSFLSALFLFIPMASPVLITVYVLVISLITIKRVLEMIRIIQVENLNDVTKIKKNVPEEAKQKNTNAPKQNIIKSTVEKNITDFEKYEREFFDTDSPTRKKELKEIMLNSPEFSIKEKDYCLMDIESLEALSQAEDIFAIIELYKRNK